MRAVGSLANCADPMTTLNAIVAKQLKDFKVEVDELIEKKDLKKDDAIFNILREYIKKSKNIRFEGDGYGEAWEKEAAKRGLSNNRNTPEALQAKISKKSIDLFSELEIMNEIEVKARYEIEMEDYAKEIQIEGRTLGDIARNHVIPTALEYQNKIIKNVEGMKSIFEEEYRDMAKEQISIIKDISNHVSEINKNVHEMIDARKKANKIEDATDRAYAYCNEVKSYFDTIRYHCDKLELIVDDELWPLVKYREMVFTK